MKDSENAETTFGNRASVSLEDADNREFLGTRSQSNQDVTPLKKSLRSKAPSNVDLREQFARFGKELVEGSDGIEEVKDFRPSLRTHEPEVGFQKQSKERSPPPGKQKETNSAEHKGYVKETKVKRATSAKSERSSEQDATEKHQLTRRSSHFSSQNLRQWNSRVLGGSLPDLIQRPKRFMWMRRKHGFPLISQVKTREYSREHHGTFAQICQLRLSTARGDFVVNLQSPQNIYNFWGKNLMQEQLSFLGKRNPQKCFRVFFFSFHFRNFFVFFTILRTFQIPVQTECFQAF